MLTRCQQEHKDMAVILRHYGAENVPDTRDRWRKLRCPFHDDSTASASTDGVGFKCFTCDLFFPAPLTLMKDREGGSWDDVHKLYHELAGAGDDRLPTDGQSRFGLPGVTRDRATSRRGGSPRRRR